MRKAITLSSYLKSYKITKKQFMDEVNKNKSFYDLYIDWNESDNATILSPKALDELGKVFNDNKMTVTVDGKTVDEINVDSSAFMTPPEENKEEPVVEKKKRTRGKSTDKKTTRRKKSQYTVTKQFLNESGLIEKGSIDLKLLRRLLMGDGVHKAEDVAEMIDSEIEEEFSKNSYVIKSDKGVYVIDRKDLNSISGSILFISNE